MSVGRSFRSPVHPRPANGHAGHAHLWDQAVSRRTFMRTAAGAAGVALGSGLWMPTLAQAAKRGGGIPNPIPGCTQIDDLGCFHFFFPGHKGEPSTITDFKGSVGVADITGTGVGTDPDSGKPIPLTFEADVRFMQGTFIGKDGDDHRGTFGFI